MDLDPICAELTYGLERIAAFLQDVDSIYDIVWARDPETGAEVTYGEVRLAEELQFSVYNFEDADVASCGSTSTSTRPRRRRCWRGPSAAGEMKRRARRRSGGFRCCRHMNWR